jgi:hypothetical protein
MSKLNYPYPTTSWSKRKEIFENIKLRLSTIEEITDVRMWNNHFNSFDNIEFKAPIAFVNYADRRTFEEISNLYYRVTTQLEIIIIDEDYTVNKLDSYKLIDAVKAYLAGWSDGFINPLQILEEYEDEYFTNLKKSVIVFELITYEQSNPYPSIIVSNGTSGMHNTCGSFSISVGIEFDSNNDYQTIRNGEILSDILFIEHICNSTSGTAGTNGVSGTNGTNGTNGTSGILLPNEVLNLINDNELVDLCDTHPHPFPTNQKEIDDEPDNDDWANQI